MPITPIGGVLTSTTQISNKLSLPDAGNLVKTVQPLKAVLGVRDDRDPLHDGHLTSATCPVRRAPDIRKRSIVKI